MSNKQALGKGFDGLIPTGFSVDAVAAPGEQIREITLEKLTPNPDQPRKSFDEEALQELARSIKNHGIIQPLVATKVQGSDMHRIVAGERRYRASKIAGLKTVPVIVRDHEQLQEFEVALVENVQRVDLSPIETAISIVRLRDEFSLSFKQIAQKLGKAETTVSNIVRLLQLPEEAIKALQDGRISEGHARTILSLKTDEKAQKELLSTIITQKLSVRDAETQAKLLKNGSAKNQKLQLSQGNVQLLEKLKNAKMPIKVKQKTHDEGTLQIKYKTQKELQDILGKL